MTLIAFRVAEPQQGVLTTMNSRLKTAALSFGVSNTVRQRRDWMRRHRQRREELGKPT
jgi:hypothetical protein